jgi:hypothetical protein
MGGGGGAEAVSAFKQKCPMRPSLCGAKMKIVAAFFASERERARDLKMLGIASQLY